MVNTMTKLSALMLAGLVAQSFASRPAVAADKFPKAITIGALLPLSGNAGFIGEEIRIGLEIYLEAVEKDRAAKGLPALKPVFVDSQADPRIGLQGYQLLRSKHEAELIYLTYTSVAIAVAPQANRDKVAMLNVTQGEVTKLGPNFTSMLPAYSIQGEIVTKEIVSRGHKNIGLIYENSEAFVVQAKAIENDVCPKLGCKVVASQQIPAGGTNVAAQVTATLAANPDAVFPIGIATQLVPIARELQTRGYKGQLFGISDMGGIAATGNGNLIEGAFYTNFVFDENDAELKSLSTTYKAKANKEPSQYVQMGFQGGQIIAGTIGTMIKRNMEWNGTNFAAAQKLEPIPTIAGPVSFLSDGRIVEPMMLVQIKDGKPTPVKRVTLN